jgi:hypothetical protein
VPPLDEYAVYEEKQERAEDGESERLKIEAGNHGHTEYLSSNPATDERAHDAERGSHQTTTRIFSRHDELCDTAGEEAEEDLREKVSQFA